MGPKMMPSHYLWDHSSIYTHVMPLYASIDRYLLPLFLVAIFIGKTFFSYFFSKKNEMLRHSCSSVL